MQIFHFDYLSLRIYDRTIINYLVWNFLNSFFILIILIKSNSPLLISIFLCVSVSTVAACTVKGRSVHSSSFRDTPYTTTWNFRFTGMRFEIFARSDVVAQFGSHYKIGRTHNTIRPRGVRIRNMLSQTTVQKTPKKVMRPSQGKQQRSFFGQMNTF